MAVVSVLGALWLLVVAWLLLRGRPWARPEWPKLQALTGVRARAVEGLAHSLTLRLSLVDRAAELSREARAGGGTHEALQLADTSLGVAGVVVPQLDERVREWRGHARVLQEAVSAQPLGGRSLRWRPLALLARGEGVVLALPLTRALRLRAHLGLLALALRLLGWRLRRVAAGREAAEPEAVQSDLAELARAVVAGYHALLLSLKASRERIEVLRREC